GSVCSALPVFFCAWLWQSSRSASRPHLRRQPRWRSRSRAYLYGWARSGALDDKGAAARILEPARQYLLVLRRVVPTLDCGGIGEFENDDALWFGLALDELGGAAPNEEPAAILRECPRHGGAVLRHRVHVLGLRLEDRIGRLLCLPPLACDVEA